jgi:hypothetical protein
MYFQLPPIEAALFLKSYILLKTIIEKEYNKNKGDSHQ